MSAISLETGSAKSHMRHNTVGKEGVLTAFVGAIQKLVRDNKIHRLIFPLKTAAS